MIPNQLSESKSSLFHFIRWISALLVVLGHTLLVDKYAFGERSFSCTYQYISSNHHSAVIFFFILSGYLISYISQRYFSGSLNNPVKTYFLDRWSRIYSVLIPVMVLTFILDISGSFLYPAIYRNPSILPQDSFGIRLIANLLSLQGTWGQNMQFGSNPALWSIGYEFTFYLIFSLYIYTGRFFYKSAIFWLGLIIFFMVRGPLVMWYLLIWYLGVLSHKLANRYNFKSGILLLLFLMLIIILCNHFIQKRNIFGFPKYINDFLFAIPISILLFFDLKKFLPDRSSKRFGRFNFFMANFSYTLYGTHLPVLIFGYSTIRYFRLEIFLTPESLSIMMVLICIIFAYFFAKISENRRQSYKVLANKILLYFLSEKKFSKTTLN